MSNPKANRKEILKMIQNKELSADEGFNLLTQNKQKLQPNDNVYFESAWKKSTVESDKDILQSRAENILVFDSIGNISEMMISQCAKNDVNASVIVVKPGKSYHQQAEHLYFINPGIEADYHQLFRDLVKQKMMPSTIFHHWSDEKNFTEKTEISRQLEQSIYSLLYLSKALMKHSPMRKVNVLYAYTFSEDYLMPQYAAVSGFARTVNKENPHIFMKLVAIDSTDKKEFTNNIIQELGLSDHSIDIKYVENQRFVRHLIEYTPKQKERDQLPLQEKGVYVITGGTGGLGMLFAKYLARLVQARLVLTGRSALTPDKQEKLEELKELGAEVVYIQADISNKLEVEALIEKTKSLFHSLNGIIHCAGVTRDSLIINKSKEEMDEVLAAKVYGAIWLDEVTQFQNLDLFIMFSSITAEFGNEGQADYSYGNCFMDRFAERRQKMGAVTKRSGKTISINWPYWKEGGMRANEQSQKWLEKVMGLVPLQTKQGYQAFEHAIDNDAAQVMVLVGEREKINETISMAEGQQNSGSPLAFLQNNERVSSLDKKELQQKTAVYLRDILSKETKIPYHKIKPDDPLEKYGIDSMIIMNLTRTLEQYFGPLSKTLFFEYQTLTELSNYFADHHAKTLIEMLDIKFQNQRKVLKEGPAFSQPALKRRTEKKQSKKVETARTTHKNNEEIAIIGISGRYPKAKNLNEFWRILEQGSDCITEILEERWDYRKYFVAGKKKKGKTYSKWGGFIDEIDKFDPLFFNISPKEAELMDPQERLFLETVLHTIEDAGYTKHRLQRNKVGVFVGVMYGQYQLYGTSEAQQQNGFVPASSYASIANRTSYYFNFQGPSIALDTMCSSSLTAIHLACMSIHKGESNVAVAGGVNLTVHPNKYLQLSEGDFTASDGRCRSFGDGGDGYVPGEGVGAVLLKPLNKAIEDNDYIYGVIKGSSVNHGGKTNGYTVPSPNAQGNLIMEALQKSNVSPDEISYLEAHGTGTSLGDPIEISGLSKAFQNLSKKDKLPIGSVKSNIGHLESAAGIAALTKVLLQMKYKKIVPSIHSEPPNPNIDFEHSPFYVAKHLEEWAQPTVVEDGEKVTIPRMAGISSFGAGGSNAHLILQEYEQDIPAKQKGNDPQLILLSAKDKDRLKAKARQMIEFITSEEMPSYTRNHADRKVSINRLQTDIVDIVSEVMGVVKEDIDINENITDYIEDHMSLSEIIHQINQIYGMEIDTTIFSEPSSIHAMSEWLYSELNINFTDQKDQNEFVNVKDGNNLFLGDIAYTLQAGREKMDERLAFVVSDIDELKGKLELFCADQTYGEDLYVGNVQDSFRSISVFDGEAGEAFVKNLTVNKELNKLAELWLSGVEIDWDLLHQGTGRRIPLPHYPFKKERYWIPPVEKKGAVEKLHPLIERNISTLNEMKFSSQLYAHEGYLFDHTINNQQIFPSLATLEIAFAAGNLANQRMVYQLEDVVWDQPLAFKEGSLDMEVSLYSLGETVEFEIAEVNDEILKVSLQGKLTYDDHQETEIEMVNLKAIVNRCQEINTRELFKRLKDQGVMYGSGYQLIKNCYLGENEAIVQLDISEEQTEETLEYTIHPALLEGAWQAVQALLIQNQSTDNYVPYKLSKVVSTRKRLSNKCYVHVQQVNQGDDVDKVFNIQMINEAEQVIVTIRDLTAKLFVTDVVKEQHSSQLLKPAVSNSLSIEKLQKMVASDIQKYAANILKMKPEQLDINTEFDQYGFDSVGLKAYADQLSDAYNVEILPTIIFSAADIKGLSQQLIIEFESEIRDHYEQKEVPKVQMTNKSKELLEPLSKRYKDGVHITTAKSSRQSEAIAIIGMSGIFPGSENLDEFWKHLESETNLITEVPKDRWDWRDFHEDYTNGHLTTKSKWGGFIPDVDKFDPHFFKISPLEAEMMDPQQRLFLQAVWHTIEDSGYKASVLSGKNIGLFAGVQFSDYQKLLASEGKLNAQMGLGNEHSILVNRVSHFLNFHGPSEPSNTACASAGTAIHRAVNSIRMGESELAIAGGICLNLAPHTMISSDQLGILSPDGKCKTLDKNADGYVKGEGVAAVMLKPLNQAIKDHDNIHAIIKGTAVNHGGKAASLTAPNPKAQTEVLVKAYEEAQIDPSTISYLELHGTGTELGDPIEIEGIKNAFQRLTENQKQRNDEKYYCGLGSVKTNIGHLEPASGIAGLLKLVLSMKNKTLPGMLHLEEVNPYVNTKNTPFYIVDKTQDWKRMNDGKGNEIPRRAGVSSFGFGGANSHIVLEEYERPKQNYETKKQHIFILSAKNRNQLKEYAKNITQYLEHKFSKQEEHEFTDFIYTLQVGREEMEERLACVVSEANELVNLLHEFVAGGTDGGNLYTSQKQINYKVLEQDSDQDDHRFIQGLINKQDWGQVAEHWVSGKEVDWQTLYTEEKPFRISLPTYPFAKERYWAVSNKKPEIIPQGNNIIQNDQKIDLHQNNSKNGSNFFDVLSTSTNNHKNVLNDDGVAAAKEVLKNEDTASEELRMVIVELKSIFSNVLKLEEHEIQEDLNLGEYGVDSIVSSVIVQDIQQVYNLSLPLSVIVEYPTLFELSRHVMDELKREGLLQDLNTVPQNQHSVQTRNVEQHRDIPVKRVKLPPELIPLNGRGHHQNAFFVHGGPGLAAFYNNLSAALGNQYPVYVFQARGVDGKTMPRDFEEMVNHYMQCIRIAQPQGPYIIGGYSFGGIIAYEMAQRFMQQGEEVQKLILFDTFPPHPEANEIFYSNSDPNNSFFKLMMGNEFANARENKAALILSEDLEGVHPNLHIAHIAKLAKERGNSPLTVEDIYNFISGACRLNDYAGSTYDTYRPKPYYGNVLYLKATDGFLGADNWMGLDPVNVYGDYDYTKPWHQWVKGKLDIVEVPCDHFNILEEPSLTIVKRSIKAIIKVKNEVMS
ncbi:SDR family NAD(P)-dependent oxidoreductase [Gracilibacillus sp. S3-1-1]|uniref:SDR family NAD(P)-dependent oxidoreductase n=1 Tax=Gracilibacillus pellucidus TaxID=3095368 RepID=A0ACC6M8F3_9BACI|nr:SDR family NAD(P)-dependent oxidoreductase [Gracilibacillus sp. S3-1-1]MDX8047244.1 SDR family NAD(P)-dependent oxidoreductase [Gracilibacillus sp. S3-1-1]